MTVCVRVCVCTEIMRADALASTTVHTPSPRGTLKLFAEPKTAFTVFYRRVTSGNLSIRLRAALRFRFREVYYYNNNYNTTYMLYRRCASIKYTRVIGLCQST